MNSTLPKPPEKDGVIRVLIVDDSAVVRRVLSTELSKHRDIEVVGSAADPYAAREKILALAPDVVTLDLEMPRMDGLTFLEKLMEHYPLPVVVVSSYAPRCSEMARRALRLGAAAIVPKPGSPFSTPDVHTEIVAAIRRAARRSPPDRPLPLDSGPASASDPIPDPRWVVAVGASTGGTQAIETVLRGLPTWCPGVLIVQHMPAEFTAAFAERLNEASLLEVRQAEEGEPVLPGVALVAPGGHHVLLEGWGSGYRVRLEDGPPVHHQRPSVDVLFQSVARRAGGRAVGVLLTGMGKDGAAGLLAIRKKGGHTIVQDERSSVVFGMPKEAIQLGAAEQVVPLEEIAEAILDVLSDPKKPAFTDDRVAPEM